MSTITGTEGLGCAAQDDGVDGLDDQPLVLNLENAAYALSVEKLPGIEPALRGKYLRVLPAASGDVGERDHIRSSSGVLPTLGRTVRGTAGTRTARAALRMVGAAEQGTKRSDKSPPQVDRGDQESHQSYSVLNVHHDSVNTRRGGRHGTG